MINANAVNAVDVAASLASRTAKRPALTDGTGCTLAGSVGVSQTVVTAGANVNGVRVAMWQCNVGNSAGVGDMTVNGQAWLKCGGLNVVETVKDLLIPPGVSVGISSSTASADVRILFEVL